MIKTKNKNIYVPLVITGYVLFALLVIGTLLSTTIPYSILLFNPRVLHFNVAVTLVAFTIGALLPMLVGYSIGDHSIKTKSKLSHHFTGVLFGLFAYWIMILMSVFIAIPSGNYIDDHNLRLIIGNIVPGAVVAIILSILAIAHVRSRQAKQDILAYKPFSLLLITFIIGLQAWGIIQNVLAHNVNFYSFLSIALLVLIGGISYLTLRSVKLSRYNKVVWSVVSVSVLFVAVFVGNQFIFSLFNLIMTMPTMEIQLAESIAILVLAIAGWVVYWSKQVKALR